MNKETLEHLSSFMDGELNQDTALFVARRMGSDAELGKTWERYHLIRECMRRPGENLVLTSIRLDLERAEQPPVQQRAAAGRWMRPLAGFAVAASVAAVAIFTVVGGPGQPLPAQPQVAQPFTSPNPLTRLPASQAVSFGAQSPTQQQLNRYLLQHNHAAGKVGRQGFVSFVPVVSAPPVQVLDGENATVQPGESALPTEGQEQP
jgi:sigma-E factor negative regulatory protein RseA